MKANTLKVKSFSQESSRRGGITRYSRVEITEGIAIISNENGLYLRIGSTHNWDAAVQLDIPHTLDIHIKGMMKLKELVKPDGQVSVSVGDGYRSEGPSTEREVNRLRVLYLVGQLMGPAFNYEAIRIATEAGREGLALGVIDSAKFTVFHELRKKVRDEMFHLGAFSDDAYHA